MYYFYNYLINIYIIAYCNMHEETSILLSRDSFNDEASAQSSMKMYTSELHRFTIPV